MSNNARALFFCLLTLATTYPALADRYDNPAPIPGWTHSEVFSDDSPQKHGLILEGKDTLYSSPVIADLDGNSSNGNEVAVTSQDGLLYAYRADGTLMWTVQAPTYNCSGLATNSRLLSSPAVGALYGDGVPYVVVGYGGPGGNRCDGGVIAVRGSDGSAAWTFSAKAFAKKARFGANTHAVFSSPALADTDGDGKLEVGFGSFDRNVYLLNFDGSMRWYYNAADTVWSSPAFANVDSDPALEMIIGTDISQNRLLRPPTKNGGFVYAFDTDKRRNPHITFQSKGSFKWRRYFDQVVQSSPVIADVLPENPGQEVIIGSGCFFPQGKTSKKGRYIKVLRLSDGVVLRTLKTAACLNSTPAVGDLDDDGIQEIVATVNGSTTFGGSGESVIQAFKASSPTPIWTATPSDSGRNDPFGGFFLSPVIADVDGNGSLEVLVANSRTVGIYNGRDGASLTCQSSGCANPLTLFAWKDIHASPTVGDVNGDGVLDIVVGGGHSFNSRHGMLYGWTGLAGLLGSPAGAQSPYSAPWPHFRGNAAHTARQ